LGDGLANTIGEDFREPVTRDEAAVVKFIIRTGDTSSTIFQRFESLWIGERIQDGEDFQEMT
jgi:hypothetical protein